MEVLFLLLIYCSAGEAHSMRALVNDDVTLSFDTKKSSDISEDVVEWSRTDLTPSIVHLHENRRTFYKEQNPAYRGRTMLSAEDLDRGIISLTLFRVRLADGGNYTCLFSSIQNKYTVQLLVGAASSPVITLKDGNSSALVLGCQGNGWYPQPKLSWWHSEGPLLAAVTMTTTQDPDRLYNISSTVVVERSSLSSPIICRVHQELFNQTRETEIHLPQNLFPGLVQSCRTIPGVFAVIGMLICVLLVALLIAYRSNHGNSQNQMDYCVTSGKTEDLSST